MSPEGDARHKSGTPCGLANCRAHNWSTSNPADQPRRRKLHHVPEGKVGVALKLESQCQKAEAQDQ
eukprot:10443098-Prorocentrum_lima.AAC.1